VIDAARRKHGIAQRERPEREDARQETERTPEQKMLNWKT
jgi:hypothetical protein